MIPEDLTMALQDSPKVEDTTQRLSKMEMLYAMAFIGLVLFWYFLVAGYQ